MCAFLYKTMADTDVIESDDEDKQTYEKARKELAMKPKPKVVGKAPKPEVDEIEVSDDEGEEIVQKKAPESHQWDQRDRYTPSDLNQTKPKKPYFEHWDEVEEEKEEEAPSYKRKPTLTKEEILSMYTGANESSVPRFARHLRDKGYSVSIKQVRAALKGTKEITDEKVRELWADPKIGLIGPSAFKKKLLLRGYRVSSGQVERALADDATRDVLQRRRFDRKRQYPVYANMDYQFMADLAFLEDQKSANKGKHVLLTIINLNTNKAYAYALTNKGEQVTDKLKEFFKDQRKEAGNKKIVFSHDAGPEFTNDKVKDVYKANNVETHTIISKEKHNALGSIERFNRSLKKRLHTIMVQEGNNKWAEHLDAAVQGYNDTPNAGNPNDTAPNDMEQDDIIAKRIGRRLRAHKVMFEDKITFKGEGGDDDLKNTKVRIATRTDKNAFGKEKHPWSNEVYTVVGSKGLGYILEDSKGNRVKAGASDKDRTYMPYDLKVTTATKRAKPVTQTPAEAKEQSQRDKKVAASNKTNETWKGPEPRESLRSKTREAAEPRRSKRLAKN